MRKTKWVMILALLAGRCAVAAPQAEVDLSFRQNVNGYAGCAVQNTDGTIRQGERTDINRQTLFFADLRLPGENVKVLSAELRMVFVEEGWGRVPNVDIELYDAAGKEAAAVSSTAYRGKKFATMDAKTRAVSWKLPPELIARWVAQPETNQGLRIAVKPASEGPTQFFFNLPTSAAVDLRPELVIHYSFTGEAAPFTPDLVTNIGGKTLGPRFTIAWQKKRWDPNGTPATYEIAVAPKGGAPQTVGKVDAEKCLFELNTTTLATDRAYELRTRAVDPTGLASEWATAPGEFRVTRSEYVIWAQDSATKVAREENPSQTPAPARLAAARNETESFQLVISALANLKGVDVALGDFTGPNGAKIPASAATLYRVHYVDCQAQGQLPDSMVPFINPKTGARIGGTYGAPFNVTGGFNAPVWVEVRVPANATPGDYKAEVKVTFAGKPAATLPVMLTVWPVTMPKTSALLTYFELIQDTPKRDYLHSLHEHRIDVWFINDLGHKLERDAEGKPIVKWDDAFDQALDDYFSGKLFADGVPGKSYLFPGGSWPVYHVIGRTDDDRIEILKQYEARYKNKPWIKNCSWFFIDEPNAQTLAKCVRVGQQIKQHSPSIGFLLTTRYNKDLIGLVDVWDPIINSEVLNWDSPGPDPYREEMKLGRKVINCITVVSDNPASPNLFIHRSAMNTRIWPWVTYALDQQGIEFWRTSAAPSVLVPRKYGAATWGDGSLFYKGLPEELGIPEEIPLPSLRLKLVRDGIEDFELLAMLRAKNPALAKSLCHKMVQETKDYDKSFAAPVQIVSGGDDGKGWRQLPGHVVWESNTTRLAETRAAIARALAP